MSYADDVLADLRLFADSDLPQYTDCLHRAFRATPPVFARERYSDFFWHCAGTVPGWLGQVVLANADAESDGSAKLLALWEGTHDNARVEREVLAHAQDEAGHAQLFVTLATLAFPDVLAPEAEAAHRGGLTRIRKPHLTKAPATITEDVLIDHLVQMNIGEIRTRLHMHLLGPAIHAFTSVPDRPRVATILQRLADDEVRHIGYTARLMEDWCTTGDRARIARLYAVRLAEFDQITLAQTEAAVRAFGGGQYPDLLEI